MKIVVFGPTGMVGSSRIVAELEQRGHEVAGASRSGGTDVTDPDSVASAAAGADAVVCAVSARGGDYTLADVARSLVDGVRRAGAGRVVTVGGTGRLEVAPGVRYVDTPGFNDEYKPEALQHAEALKVYRGIDDLHWMVVSRRRTSIRASALAATALAGTGCSSTPAATARSAPRTLRLPQPATSVWSARVCSEGGSGVPQADRLRDVTARPRPLASVV